MGWNKEDHMLSEEEYEERLKNFQQVNPYAVSRFKSTGRAARRGHLMKSGMVVPNRPYHNRKNTCKRKGKSSRGDNDLKKSMWLEIKNAADEYMRLRQENQEDYE